MVQASTVIKQCPRPEMIPSPQASQRKRSRYPALHTFNSEQLYLHCAGRKFPLEQANEAIEESQRQARGGKVFLEG